MFYETICGVLSEIARDRVSDMLRDIRAVFGTLSAKKTFMSIARDPYFSSRNTYYVRT